MKRVFSFRKLVSLLISFKNFQFLYLDFTFTKNFLLKTKKQILFVIFQLIEKANRMEKNSFNFHILIFLFFWKITISQMVYNTSEYSLGPNLINNSIFRDSSLPTATSSNAFYFITMSSWGCAFTCELVSPYKACIEKSVACDIDPSIMGVDLDSIFFFDNISQVINVTTEGQYIVYVQWFPPLLNSTGKSLNLTIGNTTIMTIYSNNTIKQSYSKQSIVNLTMGLNILSMKMFGTFPDSNGIIVHTVKVQQLITIIQPASNQTNSTEDKNLTDGLNNIFIFFVDEIFLNEVNQLLNKIPGNRIIFNFLTSFLNIFDRLYFYYYHRQNNTLYAQIFLQKSAKFHQNKNCLSHLLLQMCADSSNICKNIQSGYEYLLNKLNQKYNYSSPDFISKNSSGIGFFANYLDFIYFEAPFIFLEIFVLYVLFKLLFRFKISVFIRKYYLLFITMFLFFQGSVQEFSFYLFSELKYFFSVNFIHKMGNLVILIILFLIIIFSVAGLLWMKYHYRKLIKYLVEYYGSTVSAIICQSAERQVFPLILGFAHAFTLQNLAVQSLLLSIIQVFYLWLRIVGLRSIKTQQKLKIFFCFVASGLRLIFILTSYLFQLKGQQKINLIHRDLIIIYICCWTLQTAYNLFSKVFKSIFTLFKSQKSNIKGPKIKEKSLQKNQNQLHESQSFRQAQNNLKIVCLNNQHQKVMVFLFSKNKQNQNCQRPKLQAVSRLSEKNKQQLPKLAQRDINKC